MRPLLGRGLRLVIEVRLLQPRPASPSAPRRTATGCPAQPEKERESS